MWRVFTQSAPHTAHPNHLRPIHPQHRYGCPVSQCQSDNLRTVVAPREMVGPIILVGMKQRDVQLRETVTSETPRFGRAAECISLGF
jgi:hypothetical protein